MYIFCLKYSLKLIQRDGSHNYILKPFNPHKLTGWGGHKEYKIPVIHLSVHQLVHVPQLLSPVLLAHVDDSSLQIPDE